MFETQGFTGKNQEKKNRMLKEEIAKNRGRYQIRKNPGYSKVQKLKLSHS